MYQENYLLDSLKYIVHTWIITTNVAKIFEKNKKYN